MLFGKSLCDICIKDPFLIKEALESYENQAKEPLGSAVSELCVHDSVRKEVMIKTEALKDVLLVGIDLNLNGSIYKAIELKAFKSI